MTTRRTPITLLAAALAALAGVLASAPEVAAQGEPNPPLVPFQGRLTDGSGAALNGTFAMVFSIYDRAEGGQHVWQEIHPQVGVVEGQVNVLLGSLTPLDDPNKDGNPSDRVTFEAGPRYLGIRIGTEADQELVPRHQLVPSFHARLTDAVVENGITTPQIADGAVTIAKLAPDAGIPIGGVVLWWGATADIPAGFELCDGQLPQTPNALLQGMKPDLRNRFPMGAPGNVADVKSSPITGGGNIHGAFSTDPAALSVAQLPAHAHQVTATLTAGAHTHTYISNRCDGDDGGALNQAYALGDGSGGNEMDCPALLTPNTGGHTHALDVASSSVGSSQGHSHVIPPHENRPAFLQLFFIIRVK